MAKTRRLPREVPRLSALPNQRLLAEKTEAFLRELLECLRGLPSGFFNGTTQTVQGGTAAAAGKEGDGWSAGGHVHPLNTTGVPGDAVVGASAQGAGPGVSLSGHTHHMASVFDPVADPFILAIRG